MTTSTSLPLKDKRLLRALAYYAAYIALGLTLSAFGPTLDGLRTQTGSTVSQISIIFTANSLGFAIGALLGGRLYDRLPGQPLLAGTLLMIAAMLFATPLLPSLWLLVLVMFLLGLGMGVLDVGGNTLIIWLFGSDVGPYMNALHFCFGLGAFLSPLLVDVMVNTTGGIRWAYWVLGLIILPVALWMTGIPSPTSHGEQEKAQAITSSRNLGWLMFLLAGLMFFNVGGEISYGGLIYSYAQALDLGPDTMARVLNSVYWGAFAIGRLIAIPVATKLLPRTMLLIDLIGATISLGVVLLFPNWGPALWIGTFGFGFSIASFFATVLNFAERRMPITARVTSVILVGANLGSMVLPWLIGQFFDSVGPVVMMTSIEIATVAALLLFIITLIYVRRFVVCAEEQPAVS